MLKRLNDKLYLSLQLFNGPDGVDNRVFCELKDQLGSVVESEFEINHLSGGFFTESTKLMPSVEVLFAFFRVFESDGVTLSCDHAYSAQRIDRDFTGEQVQSIRPIAATIIGQASGANIVAEISDLDRISFDIEDSDIDGLVSDDEIQAQIKEDNITGDIQ